MSDGELDPHLPDVDLPQIRRGTILRGQAGRYRIERIIGSGAAAIVASARSIDSDERVAIKCLRSEALAYPDLAGRFAREGRAIARLRGEHVAHVVDMGTIDDNQPFLVLEYLEGEDLEAYLAARGSLSVEEAVCYVLQACSALEEAHALGIVHRDIKPANLFLAVEPDGRRVLKVLDFGVSKILDAVETPLTKPSSLLGTAVYMSPEQFRSSKNVDARTDVWALGATLFELLVGAPPFSAASVHGVMEKLATNNRESVRNARPDVPQELERVIDRALSRERNERQSTIAELAADLAPFGPPPPPPEREPPWGTLVTITLVVVAAIVFAIVITGR